MAATTMARPENMPSSVLGFKSLGPRGLAISKTTMPEGNKAGTQAKTSGGKLNDSIPLDLSEPTRAVRSTRRDDRRMLTVAPFTRAWPLSLSSTGGANS